MMIRRCLAFLAMGFALCLGAFSVQAAERVTHMAAYVLHDVGSYGDSAVRHELALIDARTGSQADDESLPSNLIALSNHFGLATAAPFGVQDWDSSHQS